MVRYRIKTEEEFKKDLGLNWYREVAYGWDLKGMSHLHGKFLDTKQNRELQVKGWIYCDSWAISTDMLVDESLFKTFNKLKRVFYGKI